MPGPGLAQALSARLDWTFIEGDELHPPANRAKMAAGIALDDDDRAPFLDAVGSALADNPHGGVAACSALKRIYRDRLRARAGDILFVLPELDQAALFARMTGRSGHFMPASLLESQLATLEMPDADENVCLVPGTLSLTEQVDAVVGRLALPAPSQKPAGTRA